MINLKAKYGRLVDFCDADWIWRNNASLQTAAATGFKKLLS